MTKIYNIVTKLVYWTVLVLLVFFAGSLVLSRANSPIKYSIFSVESGSMEPTISTGSLVVVVPHKDLKKGDIITFYDTNTTKKTVTHRIHEMSGEGESVAGITTKGDANEDPDTNLLPISRIIGKVIFHIPFLGYAVSFSKTQMGFIIMIVVPAVFIVFSELTDLKKEFTNYIAKRKRKPEKEVDLESK